MLLSKNLAGHSHQLLLITLKFVSQVVHLMAVVTQVRQAQVHFGQSSLVASSKYPLLHIQRFELFILLKAVRLQLTQVEIAVHYMHSYKQGTQTPLTSTNLSLQGQNFVDINYRFREASQVAQLEALVQVRHSAIQGKQAAVTKSSQYFTMQSQLFVEMLCCLNMILAEQGMR